MEAIASGPAPAVCGAGALESRSRTKRIYPARSDVYSRRRQQAVEEMVAHCGIVCTECPAYLATQSGDAEEQARVAEMWSKQFKADIKSEDVVCDGCLAGHTRYFAHCYECEIRACGIARGVLNCAHCDDYGCEKLAGFLEHVPDAKAKLEEIRVGL